MAETQSFEEWQLAQWAAEDARAAAEAAEAEEDE